MQQMVASLGLLSISTTKYTIGSLPKELAMSSSHGTKHHTRSSQRIVLTQRKVKRGKPVNAT